MLAIVLCTMIHTIYTASMIRSLLTGPDSRKAVGRAVLALTVLQTPDEVASLSTRHDNDRGFNAADARALTSLALTIRAGTRPITDDEIAFARGRVVKYARQLARIANARIAA